MDKIIGIDPEEKYVVVVPDKFAALKLQANWVEFIRKEPNAIFLYGNVAVVPIAQVVGYTTWDQMKGE